MKKFFSLGIFALVSAVMLMPMATMASDVESAFVYDDGGGGSLFLAEANYDLMDLNTASGGDTAAPEFNEVLHASLVPARVSGGDAPASGTEPATATQI